MKKTFLLSIFFFFFTYVTSQNVNGVAQSSIVMLANGTEISIEEVKIDDLLLTLNEDGTTIAVSRVMNIKEMETETLTKVTLANGSEILITPNHPILSDKGWLSSNSSASKLISNYKAVKVGAYDVDSFIFTLNSDLKIEVLPIIEVEEVKASSSKVYQLTLDSQSAYIANGVFVGQ